MERITPSYTVAEWCRIEKISRSLFYKLRRQGLAPELMRVGGRFRISQEAATEWRRARAADAAAEIAA